MTVILIGVAFYSISKQNNMMDGYSVELLDSIKQAQIIKQDLEAMMKDFVTIGQGMIDSLDERIEKSDKRHTAFSQQEVENMGNNPAMIQEELDHQSSFELTELIHYSSNPADEVAQENMALNFLPDLREMLKEQDQGEEQEYEEIIFDDTTAETVIEPALDDELLLSNKAFITSGRIRLHELADELRISSKTLIARAKAEGLGLNHHMNLLTDDEVACIKELFADQVHEAPTIDEGSLTPESMDSTSNDDILNSFADSVEFIETQNKVQKIIWSDLKQETKSDDVEWLVVEDEYDSDIEFDFDQEEDFLDGILEGEEFDQNITYLPTINDEPSLFQESTEPDLNDERYIAELREAHPYMAVRSLVEKGCSVKEIAKILDRSQGEITLIINVNNKKKAI